MRVHKPKVEYKLALKEKPQGSILTYYYKTNNLTRINWLNTRLIIASNKIRHEIPFKTKRVKYTAIWKKSIKIVKESKLSFLTRFRPQFFLFPPPQFWYFSPILLFSLLNVIIPSSTILLFSLLLLLILIVLIGSMWGRCRVDVESMWGQCGIDGGSMLGRYMVDVGSMWGRCRVDVGSM